MNKWLDSLSAAWSGVITHKLRSSLTMLGIVIGITAVIALMSIGRGVEAEIISQIESLGPNVVFITPGWTTEEEAWAAGGSAQTLTQEDAEAIAEQVPFVSSVAPVLASNLQMVVGGENIMAQVFGVTPEHMQVNNLEIAHGAFFTEYDYQRGAKVAVLGSDVKETLFGDADPIGQQMRMGGIVVRVIGVLEGKEAMEGSPDDNIFIPLTTFQQTVYQPRTAQGEHVVHYISLTVSDQEQGDYVVEEITSLLRSRHQLAANADDDFEIISMQEIIETVSEITGTMALFLGAIAGISLLVGGIGVMNIMLVSVMERRREIGILKALGATGRDIWTQFLMEAAFLTLAGGIIGIALGWGLSYSVSRFSMGQIPSVVTADIVILAVSVSVGIGLFFGFYPAWKASRLNPIEALRSE
ncbi:MAG: ABC transporter permease [Chloroflexi bacterium]|nr:MAG: ABC transporter permease [Chloroflexota bacterium]